MGWIEAKTRAVAAVGSVLEVAIPRELNPEPGQRAGVPGPGVQSGTELERHPETGPIELGAGGGRAWLTTSRAP